MGQYTYDNKVTVNQMLEVEQYSFPCPADVFATLREERKFTKLDLSTVYQQMRLDAESSK